MDVFISYCRRDHEWKERVATFMQSMRRLGHFDYSTWDDGEINISEDWKKLIIDAIENAKVAILLISPDFLASSFINDVEVPRILGRKEAGELVVVPVIVRPSPWEVVPWLSPIQLHPPSGEALSKGPDHEIEEHLKALTLEVHRLVQQASVQEAPEEEGVDQSKVVTSPTTDREYQFIGEKGVRQLIKSRFNEDVIETLLLYKIKTQNVWIATTSQHVYCVIDSEKTARVGRLVQWSQPIEPGMPVSARSTSRFRTAGTIDIGNKQNWLYSKRLHSDPTKLQTRIEDMLARAKQS